MQVKDVTEDKRRTRLIHSLVLARWVFAPTQFAESEAQAEAAFPAGKNNPTVVCCHGISTKMLFLCRCWQHSGAARETVGLTLCFVNLLEWCSSKQPWVLLNNKKEKHSWLSEKDCESGWLWYFTGGLVCKVTPVIQRESGGSSETLRNSWDPCRMRLRYPDFYSLMSFSWTLDPNFPIMQLKGVFQKTYKLLQFATGGSGLNCVFKPTQTWLTCHVDNFLIMERL